MILSEKTNEKLIEPKAVADFIRKALLLEDQIGQQREHVWVIGLSTRQTVQYFELVSLGTLNASMVHPREVFAHAIAHHSASIILAHNHPSGDLTPSQEDIAITERIKNCGEILGIAVVDHLIISFTSHVSMREKGHIL